MVKRIIEDDETVRYPFQAAANRLLTAYIGVYSESNWVELERRYRKLNMQLYHLWQKETISSMDPQYMTEEDIKQYVLWSRDKGLKDTSISHDITAIGNLCEYVNGGRCVDIARSRYPTLFSRKRRVRLPVLERNDFQKIVDAANSLTEHSDRYRIRRYASVMLCICAGLRTQELQHAKIKNLSSDMTTLFLDYVKGMDTYGTERTVPVRRECHVIMTLWLKIRSKDSDYIFPSPDGTFLVTNSLRKGCQDVSDELNMDFDFRKCRRTYAQYLVDEGVVVDEVAIVLGHASVKTTETNYARPRDDRVVRKLVSMWETTNGRDLL